MVTTLEELKAERLAEAAELARSVRGASGPPGDGSVVDAALVGVYYRHVPPEDVLDRSATDLFGAVAAHRRLAANRPQGTAVVQVTTPTSADSGWSAGGHSVVNVVTDDMPFLVDSVTMELSRLDRTVHLVVHPQLAVRRDVTGALLEVMPADTEAADVVLESWMHVEIDRLVDPSAAVSIEADVLRVLRDVRESVEDWPKMAERARAVVEELRNDPPPLPEAEIDQGIELLDWLAGDHFTFLGYREYRLEEVDGDDHLRGVPGTGLGILRSDQSLSSSFGKLSGAVRAKAREKTLLVLAKANSRATVHRPAYLDYVGVKIFEGGTVVGERRFLGLFSSAAYTESVMRIPVLAEKAREVLERVGFDPHSHAGKALMDTLETYPRDELFHTPADELAVVARDVMFARERRQLRAFARRDTYGRYVSVLVYLPRDRYTTAVRERFAQILTTQLGGDQVEFSVRVSESATARVHFVVHPPQGSRIGRFEVADLERRLVAAARSWRDEFHGAMVAEFGEEQGAALSRRWVESFAEGYKEDYDPATAAVDVRRFASITGSVGFDLALHERVGAGRGEIRLKIYRIGPPLSLSQILPMISSLGVEVVDERPYEFDGLDRPTGLYEFGLATDTEIDAEGRRLAAETLRAVWQGNNETDGFNALVLGAGLGWRQAALLRTYAKYMRQGSSPFALDTITEALLGHPEITRMLVELFAARFDPDRDDERAAGLPDQVEKRLLGALEAVSSLDHDRILRSYLQHITATLRTNYYRLDADGAPRSFISLKLEPQKIPDLPEPRPKFEVFVHSPRVEGVHLRYGTVARGGLRWSDRRDDFRTEVLGLVKAQMVKNTVIVPVGAKGGFYAKNLPDPSDRDAWLAEGVASYRTFISGLLDLTDNRVDGKVVPPERVVRHDGDDSYLVVAADKGTATFSDIANGVAADYGFWLGDAFASGGSVGYDHKAMGITARGAWVSVQRHFRERGIDCQTQDFTCVGIGDMSGDVFGNGMLCSEHTRLVAAFDHRHIFLDPDPDPAVSFAERRRLFELPRSSWADYDPELISAGGGVHPRTAKSVPVTEQVRRALGLDEGVTSMTPQELMRAVLKAPVDLLWNGGIGTYVKASSESDQEAGDKANDAIRVDGADLRAHCVGEGGNLGFTQLGRIEYARVGRGGEGGRINTDFIDNSAGVDTSDHEVNIKILLDKVVGAGDLTGKQRNALLALMTDEVGALVLADNYEQNLALANSAAHAAPLLHVHEYWMTQLSERGVLNRRLEGLPDSREVRRLLENDGGLTVPELSVLMAWTKIVLADELLGTDLPDDSYLRGNLFSYFPSAMRQDLRDRMEEHPLRREIITTMVVNELVNGAGITFWPRLAGETGVGPADLTRANFVAREVFGRESLLSDLCALDNRVPAALQTRIRVEVRTLCERASRWLVTHRRPPVDMEACVDFFAVTVQRVMAELPHLLTGVEASGFEARRDRWAGQGLPAELAVRAAVLAPAYQLLGVVETAHADGVDPVEVARVHFALGESLGLPLLVDRIVALPRADRWQTMARAALRDDLYGVHGQLTAEVLRSTSAEATAAERVAAWEADEEALVTRSKATLEAICRDEHADLARMSVGLRVVRGLVG